MQRCPQGHYYDPTRYSRCPACGIPDLDVQPTRGRAATEADVAPGADIAKLWQALGQTIDVLYDV